MELAEIGETSSFRDNPPSYDDVIKHKQPQLNAYSADSKPDSQNHSSPLLGNRPSAPSDVTDRTDDESGKSSRPKNQKCCFASVLIIAFVGILVASLFSYLSLKEPVSSEKENVVKSIFDCNVVNACGHADNTAAACIKIDNDESGPGYWRNQGVTEVAYDSWMNIENSGLWCMPCCISGLNKNVEMFLCESLFPRDTVLQRNSTFGRCGIDYNIE